MADEDIALEWPIKIRRGRHFREPYGFFETLVDDVPADFIDLTNYTFKVQIRETAEIRSKFIADFVVEIKEGDPLLGSIFITLTDLVTAALPLGDFFYDIMAVNSTSGEKFTWVYGKAEIIGSVTTNA